MVNPDSGLHSMLSEILDKRPHSKEEFFELLDLALLDAHPRRLGDILCVVAAAKQVRYPGSHADYSAMLRAVDAMNAAEPKPGGSAVIHFQRIERYVEQLRHRKQAARRKPKDPYAGRCTECGAKDHRAAECDAESGW